MTLGALQDFEDPFLQQTRDYYEAKSNQWTQEDSFPDYMKKAESTYAPPLVALLCAVLGLTAKVPLPSRQNRMLITMLCRDSLCRVEASCGFLG